jgi:putative hemolysin
MTPGSARRSRSTPSRSRWTPTLALLAYLQAPPPDLEGVAQGVNPAPIHCTQLGGSAAFGQAEDMSGGGWLKSADDGTNAFDLISPCVFPDGSMIDDWGITYPKHGNEPRRGAGGRGALPARDVPRALPRRRRRAALTLDVNPQRPMDRDRSPDVAIVDGPGSPVTGCRPGPGRETR